MGEDSNSCHRHVDWCGGYCYNGMGRLVIWAVIGMVGMCPIGWVEWWKCGVGQFQFGAYLADDRSLLIPPLVPSLSPAASGPQQSLDGFGWLLSDAKNVEVVAWRLVPRYWPSTLEEVLSLFLISLRAWLSFWLSGGGWVLCLSGYGCDGRDVGASLGGMGWFLFLSFFIAIIARCSICKFLSCQFPPIIVSYCILLTHIFTTS